MGGRATVFAAGQEEAGATAEPLGRSHVAVATAANDPRRSGEGRPEQEGE